MTGHRTKMWGSTTGLALTDKVQVELIRVRPTGFCSVHRHTFKDNLFLMISGELTVRWGWSEDECLMTAAPNTEIMTPSSGAILIPKMVIHQFINESDSSAVAVELYRPSKGQNVEPQDIERFSKGAVH